MGQKENVCRMHSAVFTVMVVVQKKGKTAVFQDNLMDETCMISETQKDPGHHAHPLQCIDAVNKTTVRFSFVNS